MQVFRNGGRRAIHLGVLVTSLLAAGAAMAHHSFAMFDSEHQVKISGQITKFDWTNPHIYLFITGGEAGAEAKAWTIEGASPGILNRVGWKFNMIKPNDKLTVIVAPLRTGEPGALLKQLKLANGTKMENGGPAGPPNIPID